MVLTHLIQSVAVVMNGLIFECAGFISRLRPLQTKFGQKDSVALVNNQGGIIKPEFSGIKLNHQCGHPGRSTFINDEEAKRL